MAAQMNWQKIRNEFNRLTDVDQLKNEVQRIGNEIRNFDIHVVLSPTAKQRMKGFEKRYSTVMRSLSTYQRQMDREFNRILRQIKSHRTDVEKAVSQQKNKLEKAATGLRKRFGKKAATGTRKRASAKTAKSSRKKA